MGHFTIFRLMVAQISKTNISRSSRSSPSHGILKCTQGHFNISISKSILFRSHLHVLRFQQNCMSDLRSGVFQYVQIHGCTENGNQYIQKSHIYLICTISNGILEYLNATCMQTYPNQLFSDPNSMAWDLIRIVLTTMCFGCFSILRSVVTRISRTNVLEYPRSSLCVPCTCCSCRISKYVHILCIQALIK